MQSRRHEPMTVIGAGSWGTALAIQLAREGHPTRLWGRDAAQLEAMRHARRNERYLPDARFPGSFRGRGGFGRGARGARDALIAVPSHAFRATLEQLKPHLEPDARIAWATKGFEIATGLLPHQVAGEIFGDAAGRGVVRARRLRSEVGAGLPTAMTVASGTSASPRSWRWACRGRISAPTRNPTSWASRWAAR